MCCFSISLFLMRPAASALIFFYLFRLLKLYENFFLLNVSSILSAKTLIETIKIKKYNKIYTITKRKKILNKRGKNRKRFGTTLKSPSLNALNRVT